ncbi:hypothetical protein BD770DRAFT_444266 [Pilaira anomala]|nr:hypothetical protein BD770DRAFT_444266 [Pilaira anomala]
MKQEAEKNINNTVFEKVFIKQEAEEDKECFTRALRNPVRERSPHSDEGEEPDNDFKRSKESHKNQYCRLCNFTNETTKLYARHEIQIHNTRRFPNIDIGSLHCNTSNLTLLARKSYRQHMLGFHTTNISRFHNGPPRKYEPSTFDTATSYFPKMKANIKDPKLDAEV